MTDYTTRLCKPEVASSILASSTTKPWRCDCDAYLDEYAPEIAPRVTEQTIEIQREHDPDICYPACVRVLDCYQVRVRITVYFPICHEWRLVGTDLVAPVERRILWRDGSYTVDAVYGPIDFDFDDVEIDDDIDRLVLDLRAEWAGAA